MAHAQGARAQMALAFETVYGTPPVSGYRLMALARTTRGAEQPLLNSELLGYLPVPRVEIAGPQGIQASFDWQATKATSPARMCTAVLVNTVTGY